MNDFPRTNTQRVPVCDIGNIYVQYRLDDMVLLTAEGDELVLEEHLCWDMEDCDAKIAVSGRDMTIQGGVRPASSNKGCLIKLYLPVSYRNNLRISNDTGAIASDVDLKLAGRVEIRVVSGSIHLQSVCAETVNIDAQSGSISLDRITSRALVSATSGMISVREVHGQTQDLHADSGSIRVDNSDADNLNIRCESGTIVIGKAVGTVDATCSSGQINVHDMNGSGVFTAHSGNITLLISGNKGKFEVNSDVGNIKLSIPRGASCALDVKSMTGSIQRSSGEAPELVINARAGSGKINITEHGEAPV
jgi:DUF4097 and DUF4098 domain-containing protein YvlB